MSGTDMCFLFISQAGLVVLNAAVCIFVSPCTLVTSRAQCYTNYIS